MDRTTTKIWTGGYFPEPASVTTRVGWLLRTTRLGAKTNLRELSAQIADDGGGGHASTLSRVEQSGTLNLRTIAAYERALDVQPGALQAAAVAMARSLPCDEAPGARAPAAPRLGLAEFSRRVAAVADRPHGGDWLAFALAHHPGAGSGFGLTESDMATHVERLTDERVRAVGVAMIARREALASLRQGPYREVVSRVAARVTTASRCVPPWRSLRAVLPEPPRIAPGPGERSHSRRDPRWVMAERIATRASTAAALPEQPLLARLLFELLFDGPGHSEAAASAVMVSTFAGPLRAALLDVRGHQEPRVQLLAQMAAVAIQRAGDAPVPPLLHADLLPMARRVRLRSLALAGQRPEPSESEAGMSDPASRAEAVFALGMADPAALADIARYADDPGVAASAAWWAERDGLVGL